MKHLLIACIQKETMHNLKQLSSTHGVSIGECVDRLVMQHLSDTFPNAQSQLNIARSLTAQYTIRDAETATAQLLQNAKVDDVDISHLQEGDSST